MPAKNHWKRLKNKVKKQMNNFGCGNLFRKTLSCALVCASLSSFPAFAAPVDDAGKYVENVGNKAIETLSNKKLDKEVKRNKIEQLFRDNVDINWIGKFVLGRFFRQATDEQKKRYFKEYETFLVRHYATRFTDYTSGSFTITNSRDDGGEEFTINMQIKSGEAGSEPISVDYRVRADNSHKDGFVIFDITVEGVSMITTQRSEFSSVITNKGMDYLITQLADKSNGIDRKPN